MIFPYNDLRRDIRGGTTMCTYIGIGQKTVEKS